MNLIEMMKINVYRLISYKIFVLIVLLLITSCSSTFNLIDDYCVSHEYEPYNQVFCNPGCDSDVSIDYVKSIRWNAKQMIIEQQIPKEESIWYLVIAKKDSLRCCCNDSIFGPFSDIEIKEQISNRKINITNMNEKVWSSY